MADNDGFEDLFNGKDLTGWFAAPRVYGGLWVGGPALRELQPTAFSAEYWENAPKRPAAWTVEDGAIVGRQDKPGSGYGGYLVSERAFGDFELVVESKPDWPADTGIMVRRKPDSWHGIQITVDYRQSGSIGGFYGNGIGGFSAIPFAMDAIFDEKGKLVGLKEDDPATSIQPIGNRREPLTEAATFDEFLAAWKVGDWNEIRVRVVGAKPVITTWVNGAKMAELDLGSLVSPRYDADEIAEFLGPQGRIAFEVHDSDEHLGKARWGVDAACRWRNIRIKTL